MCEKQTFTRQELYELVWKTPMRRLARQFGLSDVGLAKTCQRHNIPKPPPGYWAKKAHGKIVRRRSLPPCDDPALATITICPRSTTANLEDRAKPPSLGSTFFDQELGRLAELEAGGKDPIVVAESLRSPHPLVARTQEGFSASKRDKYQREPTLCPRMVGDLCCLEVRVGPDTIHRTANYGCSAKRAGETWLQGVGSDRAMATRDAYRRARLPIPNPAAGTGRSPQTHTQ